MRCVVALWQVVQPLITLLIGSAPVGPTTVRTFQKCLKRLPTVRFGSTETCLQVMGTPLSLTPAQLLVAFERGWKHAWKGELQTAYYIGREHPGFTEVRVVRNVKEGAPGYLEVGEWPPPVRAPGHIDAAPCSHRTASRASRASSSAVAPI